MSELRKELGKIQKVHFGIGGYQDAMIGYNFTLGQGDGSGWGVCTQWKGHWCSEPTDHSKWTDADRIKALGEAMKELGLLLQDAKKTDVYQLVGVPIEATFDGMVLQSWRILKEVL